MPTIAISYRRSDSSAIAGRIFDRLTAHYGEDAVFMDIDNIPFGTDFRSQIYDVLLRTDVVLAVIGANWRGVNFSGAARIHEPADPVRVEIETALARRAPIIPVLVDGAKMPSSTELPAEFSNFAYLNAAEVATGRDFRAHMDRLIAAIEQIVAGDTPPKVLTAGGQTKAIVADKKPSAQKPWLADILRYFVMPLVLLVVFHHVVVNALDLNVRYLWLVSVIVPSGFGFAYFWLSGRGTGPAIAFAVALGLIGVAAMTVAESLNSGDPLIPQTRFEWRDNIQFAGTIALSFIAGNLLARALGATLSRRSAKS